MRHTSVYRALLILNILVFVCGLVSHSNGQGAAQEFLDRGGRRAAQGDFTGAEDDLTKVLAMQPKLLRALMLRATVRTQLGKFDQAMTDWEKAFELEPQNAEAYMGRAATNLSRQAFDRAKDDSSRAIQLNPKLAQAYMIRAISRTADLFKTSKSEWKAAAKDYEQASVLFEAAGDQENAAVAKQQSGFANRMGDAAN